MRLNFEKHLSIMKKQKRFIIEIWNLKHRWVLRIGETKVSNIGQVG